MGGSPVAAVIPAAGSGSRMAAAVPKQFMELNGHPLLDWTLAAIARADEIGSIILVVPPGDLPHMAEKYVGNPRWPKVARAVAGGATRAESVYNGVRAAGAEWILAHDAARPFVTPALVRRTVEAALRHGAATAALPAHDTLKTRDGDFLGETLDRAAVLHIQTPQVFRAADLLAAHEKLRHEGKEWTDETSLLQQAGIKVAWVPGEAANMKITTPDDFRLAQVMAERSPFVKGPARV
ncbi:MAG: 2-C-methyl-D-erythritol 4-phosphate cytidylyltransferase [Nitrospinae bacterium]|nr:2-C-methyl-D-erythritol 4-phosphate cytidylyltransferase [Nitrospinota bacterium]